MIIDEKGIIVSNMNKKKLHHLWTRIRPISYWYFLVLFIVSSIVFVFAYRQNNLRAIELREKLLEVDKQNGDVEASLNELREFIYSHMNADLTGGPNSIYPPIQLAYTYERLVQAEKGRVVNAQKAVNDQANAHCAAVVPENGPGTNRVPCITQYIQDHPVTEQSIPDDLYKFNFVAPIWSSDLAGWSLLASILFLFLFVVRLLLEKWLKYTLAD